MKVYSFKSGELRVGSRDPVRCPMCSARRIVRIQLGKYRPECVKPGAPKYYTEHLEELCELECGWIGGGQPRWPRPHWWSEAEEPPSDGVFELTGILTPR